MSGERPRRRIRDLRSTEAPLGGCDVCRGPCNYSTHRKALGLRFPGEGVPSPLPSGWTETAAGQLIPAPYMPEGLPWPEISLLYVLQDGETDRALGQDGRCLLLAYSDPPAYFGRAAEEQTDAVHRYWDDFAEQLASHGHVGEIHRGPFSIVIEKPEETPSA